MEAGYSRLAHAATPMAGAACASAANYLLGFDRWSSHFREARLIEFGAAAGPGGGGGAPGGGGGAYARASAACTVIALGESFEGAGEGAGEGPARGDAIEVRMPAMSGASRL
jgi:hypothetical protein